MASEPKTTKRLVLNSNTQATKRKVRVLNHMYRVKGIQCHSNHLPQLFELKKKKQQTTKQIMLFKRFLCYIL